MPLPEADRERIVAELGREPTPAEAALFENLWSEHCAYRSSRPLLSAFDSESEDVVVGPGDDAAVVAVPTPDNDRNDADSDDDVYVTLGIESHNHPSYVDPYDGAATGVGGIVRDTLSMGAYPIALTDSLYFGGFDREHSRYLFDGVVEGIADYGNAIGVPTVGGSVAFHSGYEGNPLVNVACAGLLPANRLVTAEAQRAGNKLVLVGNATGRDGLGGASFASEDLAEDAETEDRPAVQVGDPYTEKLLIEANEALLDEDLVQSARDLGAAGLGGASSELVAKGDLGAEIDLEAVHRREPGMNATEILLAESQERMCYEVRPEDTDRVREIAERFDLGCSVIGEITEGNYTCSFGGEAVVDVPATYLADGAPMNDLPAESPTQPERDLPDATVEQSFERVLSDPNTASKEWVYRQYDHEVGLRTAVRPGDDAAVMDLHEAGVGLAISAGAEPRWTSAAPYEGACAIALENATNLAATGAKPLAAVDCLNGGNPEKPDVYGGFSAIVDGLADMCSDLSVPVVGGNVSLYNDSVAGPIPPTPTLAMVGTRAWDDSRRNVDTDEGPMNTDEGPMHADAGPSTALAGEGTLLVVGDRVLDGEPAGLGGSAYLALEGSDRFPSLPANPAALVEALATVANHEATTAVHDASHGGLAVTLAEMVTPAVGATVEIEGPASSTEHFFHEQPGRAVVETKEPTAVREAFAGIAPVHELGSTTDTDRLEASVGDTELSMSAETIAERRAVLDREMD
ncbi:phosphoribosylformylglycinamidine synthase subunit PurL [Halococcus saccharolyticus]|uniref:Phosphoribosylformylglycinamidine synthase subunit PurL n=1 Tax=Halococcus saccharolyticus DSM 5350 TaxID=1227455 RepID=M0MJ58_9EURY|nr:phosphoribosylformylglycinamidine synthase subunit PurL [Halococcus saccharolyticus]EMA45388.1 phosphoribosylformylglycinamidine synthase II [Halococcus saccharolyticus DSM 5350]